MCYGESFRTAAVEKGLIQFSRERAFLALREWMHEPYFDCEAQAVATTMLSTLGGSALKRGGASASLGQSPRELRLDRLDKNFTITLEAMLPS